MSIALSCFCATKELWVCPSFILRAIPLTAFSSLNSHLLTSKVMHKMGFTLSGIEFVKKALQNVMFATFMHIILSSPISKPKTMVFTTILPRIVPQGSSGHYAIPPCATASSGSDALLWGGCSSNNLISLKGTACFFFLKVPFYWNIIRQCTMTVSLSYKLNYLR